MKKVLLVLLMLLVIGAAIVAWIFFGAATGFKGIKEVLYISTNASTKEAVMDSLRANNIIRNEETFEWLASRMSYWNKIKPGKYEIREGSSLIEIVRKLRNGQQTPVDFTITKIRTKQGLAKLAGRKFEFDSTQMMSFLNNPDSLNKYSVNPEQAMVLVMPDTYTFYWNTTPANVYKKLSDEANKFWNDERKRKAEALGLTPVTATILASIVEEETNANEEKDTIASVYLNRIRKGMPLQADPTVKFALQDFGLRRIYHKHLTVESPYNTYRNKGLPPGPIATPSKKTIDEVLEAPQTDYIYFVASPEFNGRHLFSVTYNEHLQKARLYQQALNRRDSIRNNK